MNPAVIAMLIVAVPACFLLAHHLPLLVARRVGRRHGVVEIGSAADRALPRLRHLVIEVDRVVTTGHLVVVDVAPFDDRHKRDLRWFAGALAHGSADPVARAIARLSGPGRTAGVREGPAHELAGAVDRHPVRIGLNGADRVGEAVGTTVRVDVDLRPMGHITVAEEVRQGAARRLSSLRADGVEPVLVSPTLTKPDLARVAEEAGVEESHPGATATAVAATLPADATGMLRAATSPDGAHHGELVLPGEVVLRCADCALDTVLGSLRVVRSLRLGRRVAGACAVVVTLGWLALAGTGRLTVPAAGVAAAAGLLVVAVVAALAALPGTEPAGAE